MASSRKKSSREQRPILGDFIVSWAWVFISSIFAEVADYLKPWTGLDDFTLNIAVLILALIAFAPICTKCWGAIFNPVNSLALIASGKGPVGQNVARMASQLAGAFLGSYAARTLVPASLQSKFPMLAAGLRSGVSLGQGAACEALLGAAMNTLFLVSIDSSNKLFAFWTPLAATVVMCYVGAAFTGPSMNPSMAFSWNWHYNQHSLLEHVVVFWVAPLAGALLAGGVYRLWQARRKASRHGKGAKKKAASGKAKPESKGSSAAKPSTGATKANGTKGDSRSVSPAAKRPEQRTSARTSARKGGASEDGGVGVKQEARRRTNARSRAE